VETNSNEVQVSQEVEARIKSISHFGEVKLAFNVKMIVLNISLINDTSLSLYIEPAENRDLAESEFNYTTVNFTWKPVEMTEKELTVKLDFFDPVSISPLETQDLLVFHFKEPLREYLISP
jgi:hypothetical protein